MDTLSSRLLERRKELGLSQAALAKLAQVSQSTIGNIESGIRTSPNSIPAIAAALGVRAIWLTEGKLPKLETHEDTDYNPRTNINIPMLDIKLSAGNGNLIWEVDTSSQISLPRSMIDGGYDIKPDCIVIVVADGNSMLPTIHHDDRVIVDICETKDFINNKVYALAIDDMWFIKRVKLDQETGGIRIISDNPDKKRYPDKQISPDRMDSVRIIGRCIARLGPGSL